MSPSRWTPCYIYILHLHSRPRANILFRLVSFRRLAYLLGSALLQELFILNTSIISAYTGGSAWIYYMYLFFVAAFGSLSFFTVVLM